MLSEKVVDAEARAVIDNFGRYFREYPTHEHIDWQTFVPQFQRWNPGMKEERFKQFINVFKAAMPNADEDQRRNLVSDLAELGLGTEIANYIAQYEEGELDDLFGKISAAGDKYKQRVGFKLVRYIDTPIDELINREHDNTGLAWRLRCLQSTMRPLRPGDFGIIAARPDKGKTSFVASEVTRLAEQLPSDKNIVWLNNEGFGDRIIPRIWQAALNVNMPRMKVLSDAGKLVDMWRSLYGRLDKIRVIDVHGLNNTQVEMLIEDNHAGVAVFDMIDNIRGFSDGAARTDQVLEKMYQWGRDTMIKYGCVGLATSQISNDGQGLMFPTMNMLKDSKTGKQGACDFQIMVGASDDEMYERSRFIGIPKNKLRLPEGPGNPKAEVIFHHDTSRFEDIDMQIAGAEPEQHGTPD